MNSPSGSAFKLDVTVEFVVADVPAEIDMVGWNQHLFIKGVAKFIFHNNNTTTKLYSFFSTLHEF